jgi:hypothetical protein
MISKKKYLKFSLLIVLLLLLIWNHFSKFNNHHSLNLIKNESKEEEKNNNQQCELEWERLNENVYFRKNLAYYYIDLDEIHLYLERNKNFNYKFKFQIEIVLGIEKIIQIDLPNNRIINIHTLDVSGEYATERIHFRLNVFMNNNKSLINMAKIKVKIKSILSNVQEMTKNSIELVKKMFKTNDFTNNNNNSILCSKVYYLKSDYIKQFEWWIQVNKLNGYDKIVVFNNSLDGYDDLFKKYAQFVQVLQFQCVPNFFSKKNHKKKRFISFFDIKNVYNLNPHTYHIHFDHLIANECYLLHKDKYKYISIIDNDELILARSKLANNNNNNFSKIISYIQSLTSKLSNGIKTNLIFKMSFYFKFKSIQIIFYKLEEFFKLIKANNNTIDSYNYRIKIDLEEKCFDDEKIAFNLVIKTGKDLNYAKYLYEMNRKYVEPFMEMNKNELKRMNNDLFDRFYYFTGEKSIHSPWLFKSIHDTSQTEIVNAHFALNKIENSVNVPVEYGHCSHFRKNFCSKIAKPMLLIRRQLPIQELFFDFDYFQYFYKPILKNLNYMIKE